MANTGGHAVNDSKGTVSPGAGGPPSLLSRALAGLRSLMNVLWAILLGRSTSPPHVDDFQTPGLKSQRVAVHDLTPFLTFGDRPFAISPCSDLYKATLLENIVVVVRRIRFQDDEANSELRLRTAAAVLARARHVNVLCYVGTYDFQGSLCIVSPFAYGGNLGKHIVSHPDCDRRNLLMQVARGLLYLHQSGIVHGNLHPRNVLLSEDGVVKVSDFGLGEIIPDEGSTSMRPAFAREKAMHRSPETHAGDSLSPASDVYSFGMLVFHAYCDKEPMVERYPGAIQVVAALLAGHRPLRGEIVRVDFSTQVWEVVQQCWSPAKEKRLAMAAVVEALSNEMLGV